MKVPSYQMAGHFGLTFCGRAHTVQEVEEIAQLGLRCVEINLLQGQVAMGRLAELNQMAKEMGLSYLVHAPNEGDPRDLERLGGAFQEQILKLVEDCLEIGAKLLTVHFWMDRRFIPQNVVREKALILARMAREAARRGVRICLENLSEDPQDLLAALEASPELGLTLDVGHGQLMCTGNRASEILKSFPHRVYHVHLHDNRGGQLVGDDLHLPIGQGCVDFKAFLGALVEKGYRHTLTFEIPVPMIPSSLERVLRILEDLNGSSRGGGPG